MNIEAPIRGAAYVAVPLEDLGHDMCIRYMDGDKWG